MPNLDDALRVEAEARKDLLAHFTGNPEDEFDTECEPLNFYADAVRHTVEVRAEALLTQIDASQVVFSDAFEQHCCNIDTEDMCAKCAAALQAVKDMRAALTAFREGVK